MPAPFAALENRLSAAVAATFGEDFILHPYRATPGQRREPDPDRQPRSFQAEIDDRNAGSTSFARLGKSSGGTATSGGAPQFTTSNPKLFVDLDRLGGSMPQRLDRIRRVDTAVVYEVTNIAKDGQGRLTLDMVQVA